MDTEKLNIYKTSKIGKNKWCVKRPKRRLNLNVLRSLNVCHHKGRWIVALTDDGNGFDRTFRSCDTINRTEAFGIIGLLTEFINLVKPTEASALSASIKSSTNRTCKIASELSAISIDAEARSAK